MAKKPAKTTQVSIAGVVAFGTPAERMRSRRKQTVLSPLISAGAVYGIGLSYPPPGVMPKENSPIAALACTASGVVFSATSGKQSHVIRMPRPMQLIDGGPLPGIARAAADLPIDGNGMLYIAGRDKGNPLYRLNVGAGLPGSPGQFPRRSERVMVPFRDDGVGGMAISADGATLALLGECTGSVLLYHLKTRKRKKLPGFAQKDEAFSRRIGAGTDNRFYVTGLDGAVFAITTKGDAKATGLSLPCAKGKNYLARASAFLRATNGRLYGGTKDGFLFSIGADGKEIVNHGRGSDVPDLHCLAEGADGLIYGIVGRGRHVSHLVRFDPVRAEWADLGLFSCYGLFPWTAYQIGALVACPDGRLVAGEAEAPAHLFAYHPPVRCGESGSR